MKAFVFLINGSYEAVISTNQRQAEKIWAINVSPLSRPRLSQTSSLK